MWIGQSVCIFNQTSFTHEISIFNRDDAAVADLLLFLEEYGDNCKD
jgi:hypothetical protein